MPWWPCDWRLMRVVIGGEKEDHSKLEEATCSVVPVDRLSSTSLLQQRR